MAKSVVSVPNRMPIPASRKPPVETKVKNAGKKPVVAKRVPVKK